MPQTSFKEIDASRVRTLFKNLEQGNGEEFFKHVADDVDWIVEGTHPLAGHYHSKKDFLANTFDKLAQVLPQGAQLHVTNVLISGEWSVVELQSLATAKNGFRFDNKYCWICHFKDQKIDKVRAYLDSTMVAKLFEQNPVAFLKSA